MFWVRDLLSPSNLWTAFQFFFPVAAAAVSGWVSSVWKLPPSVSALIALMTAACIIIILDSTRSSFNRRNKYIQRITELEAQLEPKLEMIPTSYVFPTTAERGIRTVRLEVTNVSHTILRNCRLREARFVNIYGQESQMRRPFRLNEETLANMASHIYKQTFNLHGKGATEIIEIAQLDETQDDTRVVMLYATAPNVPQLNAIVRECFPHRLTVSVTAENMLESFERTYELFIKNGRLQMESVKA